MTDLTNVADELNREAAALAEALRVQAVERLGVMDTLPEVSYEDIVALVAQICDVPIATVTLLDADRQWHKAMFGLSEDMRECPRDGVLCNVTIQTPDTETYIYDAAEDTRVSGLPFVNGTYDYIRFYAGMPLVDPDGYVVGTLCAMDRVPRKLREDQIQAMNRLRRLVTNLLFGN